jgi:hypothetical protein
LMDSKRREFHSKQALNGLCSAIASSRGLAREHYTNQLLD